MSGKDRKQLVTQLKKNGYITSTQTEQAFLKTPREIFIPDPFKTKAYHDTPLHIGHNQTISAPHMVAIMCEALDLKPGQRVLEIGAGSGYHAAIVATIIGETGHVYSIERITFLADFASKNIEKSGIPNVTIITDDGSYGDPKHAPFDRIYITCAAPKIPPPLIDQLKQDGKMLMPVGDTMCILKLYEKTADGIIESDLGGCAFVPMLGRYGHQK